MNKVYIYKKVEHRERKRQKEKEKVQDIQRQTKNDRKQKIIQEKKETEKTGSEKTKIKKCMFHLENT